MRLGDLDLLKDGLKCHYQSTDEKYETDRQWAVGYNAGLNRALHSITYAKTIDAVPVVHGRWVSKDSRYPFSWRYCSECGYHVTASMARNYKGCPICLARMDGVNVDG